MRRIIVYSLIALGVVTSACGGENEPAEAPSSAAPEGALAAGSAPAATTAAPEHLPSPPTAQVSTGSPDIRGPLTREVVEAVVQRHLDEVRLCYEQGLAAHTELAKRVTVTMLIAANGAVQGASVSSSTLNSAPVEQCITAAARRWPFPAPAEGGIVGVTYPFVLSTTNAETASEPTPQERAQAALDESRYEDVCAYLVSRGFSSVICDWLVATARANRDRPLSTDRFERFLRDQHVRRVSGSIVGWYDEAHNEYEVRVGGRPAILVASETAFETTGRFTMWAQQHGTSDEVLNSGREVSVPVYREWPLFQAILDTARARGDAAAPAAVSLLRELLRAWETDYCHTPDPDGVGECYVDPNLPPPGVSPPTPEAAMRELRALLPPTWGEHAIVPEVTAVAAYLREHALRYDQLAAFPGTRLSALRADPELRGRGWVASGTVVQVLANADAPAIVFWRGDTCTYAIVPNAASISNHADVRFAGVAIQPYRWRNLVGREQDCIVAVGYLGTRG